MRSNILLVVLLLLLILTSVELGRRLERKKIKQVERTYEAEVARIKKTCEVYGWAIMMRGEK